MRQLPFLTILSCLLGGITAATIALFHTGSEYSKDWENRREVLKELAESSRASANEFEQLKAEVNEEKGPTQAQVTKIAILGMKHIGLINKLGKVTADIVSRESEERIKTVRSLTILSIVSLLASGICMLVFGRRMIPEKRRGEELARIKTELHQRKLTQEEALNKRKLQLDQEVEHRVSEGVDNYAALVNSERVQVANLQQILESKARELSELKTSLALQSRKLKEDQRVLAGDFAEVERLLRQGLSTEGKIAQSIPRLDAAVLFLQKNLETLNLDANHPDKGRVLSELAQALDLAEPYRDGEFCWTI